MVQTGRITVYHYDAFSNQPGKGNPAGVVIDGEGLSAGQMKVIAGEVGFSETSFVMKSDCADLRIRYFKPGHEMELCGHGTIGTLYCLKIRGLLKQMGIEREQITIETKAGILPIGFSDVNGEWYIRMKQVSPQFLPFRGSVDQLADALQIQADEIDQTLPIVYGSTGTWTLFVPIKRLETFAYMRPENRLFPKILTELPDASVHPFCLETYAAHRDMHSRHFCAPHSGTIEDAITGTASGVMGAYYGTYIDQGDSNLKLIMEQGQELGRDGEVAVFIDRNRESGTGKSEMCIAISGTAVFVIECLVVYEIKECEV